MREFRVRAGCEKDFELVFGPDGVWPCLLQPRSQGYIGTELKLLAAEERRYEVRDFWRSHQSFEVFRDWYQADIERFCDWLRDKDVVEHETLVGSFYTSESGEGDDAGLVSA